MNSKPHLTAVQEVSNCLGLNLDVDKLRLDSNSIPYLRIIVAVQKANILATAFHPELGKDDRWIRFFFFRFIYNSFIFFNVFIIPYFLDIFLILYIITKFLLPSKILNTTFSIK